MLRLFSSLVFLAAVVAQASAADFNLPYELYSDGDKCTLSNYVGTGTLTSLSAMDMESESGAFFCETDVLDPPPPEFPDPITIYTRIQVRCDGGTTGDHVTVSFWNCTTADCSECAPYTGTEPLVTGTTAGSFLTAKNAPLYECFYGWPAPSMDITVMVPVPGYMTFDETMGATLAQGEEFFNMLITNSCMADMSHADGGHGECAEMEQMHEAENVCVEVNGCTGCEDVDFGDDCAANKQEHCAEISCCPACEKEIRAAFGCEHGAECGDDLGTCEDGGMGDSTSSGAVASMAFTTFAAFFCVVGLHVID